MKPIPEQFPDRFTRRHWTGVCLASIGAALFAEPGLAQTRSASGAGSDSSRERQGPDAAREGLQWLAKRQRENGSFVTDPQPGDPGIAAIVGKAFLAAGSLPGRGDYGDLLTKCVGFIVAGMGDSGYIRNTSDGRPSTMYSHAFATAFLAEAYHGSMNERLRDTPCD